MPKHSVTTTTISLSERMQHYYVSESGRVLSMEGVEMGKRHCRNCKHGRATTYQGCGGVYCRETDTVQVLSDVAQRCDLYRKA